MKFCTRCASRLEDASLYCTNCGLKQSEEEFIPDRWASTKLQARQNEESQTQEEGKHSCSEQLFRNMQKQVAKRSPKSSAPRFRRNRKETPSSAPMPPTVEQESPFAPDTSAINEEKTLLAPRSDGFGAGEGSQDAPSLNIYDQFQSPYPQKQETQPTGERPTQTESLLEEPQTESLLQETTDAEKTQSKNQPQSIQYVSGNAVWLYDTPAAPMPVKRIAIYAACALLLIIGAALAVILWLPSPAERAEESLRDAVESFDGTPESILSNLVSNLALRPVDTDNQSGFGLLEKLFSAPLKVEWEANLEELIGFSVDGSVQSDAWSGRLMLDMATATPYGEGMSMSVYADGGDLFFYLPMFSERSLYLDLNTATEKWSTSAFGQLAPLDEATLESFAEMAEIMQNPIPHKASQNSIWGDRMRETTLRLFDSLHYETLKNQELPSGSGTLSCVQITVPKEALICFYHESQTLVIDYIETVPDLADLLATLPETLPGFEEGGLRETLEALRDESVASMEAMELEVSVRVFYEKNRTRAVHADIKMQYEYMYTHIVAYLEAADASDPLKNWQAARYMYDKNGELFNSAKVSGEYTFTEGIGHSYEVRFEENVGEYDVGHINLSLLWNPANLQDNLYFECSTPDSAFFLRGTYLVGEDMLTLGLREFGVSDNQGMYETVRPGIVLIISAIEGVEEPAYTKNYADLMTMTEEELAELLSGFGADTMPYDMSQPLIAR